MSFHPATLAWFEQAFTAPTPPQKMGWPAIQSGESTLLLAPTGTGKTLTAFLWCIDRLMFTPVPEPKERCRVLYVSPLKALAVDVERNLRSPLVGIDRIATARGDAHHVPLVSIRSGDTPAQERARFLRRPSDILITTPESLYLLLTSQARELLRTIDTVIIDEIHALVPSKRGAHLLLSIERLQALTHKPLQRIGLSATQHPLDEAARFLGGGRPVRIVDAGAKKTLQLAIEVPVEDMAKRGKTSDDMPSGPSTSMWSAIHPRLFQLIRAHNSTLVFVNSRRVAERLAAALNELAGDTLVYAHHASLARETRLLIEGRLKAGEVKALIATSSLELGIDMGAIDLVVQIEAPPTVASGMQRIGRAGHSALAPSRGIIFPKHRGDLLACAALTAAMHAGEVESSRYPRNPIDVLAQHIVAMVGVELWQVDALFALVRAAAPYADLQRPHFDSLLDMLAGRYASDDFAGLKARITWDRVRGEVSARDGSKKIAISNGGTIPDRGLYGAFVVSADKKGARVGELDEEMVFESKVGETFILGASTWRIEEITHDRVYVSPAPGEPGRMPFWRGEAAGRSLELGQKIGALTRTLVALPASVAQDRLIEKHDLEAGAARNLVQYLEDQNAATGSVPDDRTLVVERTRNELGDWRVCVLSPLGGRVHAPWSMAAVARVRERLGVDVESMWTNDGFVLRFPGSEVPPATELLLPSSLEVRALVIRELGGTALFAAHFRENAARALLLPRRRPGKRTPLWQQRKRSADLLAVAARHPSFPILLETYRECLRDVFDLPALSGVLRALEEQQMQLVTVEPQRPSPFASALLFGFTANYLYDADAPLAERRAHALSIDHAQLRELIGEAELRELLDSGAMQRTEDQLQQRGPDDALKSKDGVHDLLLRVAHLCEEDIAARAREPTLVPEWIAALLVARRIIRVKVAGKRVLIAVEDAARYRDALGTVLAPGLPAALLESVADPLRDLVLRYARTHAPFTALELASSYGLSRAVAEAQLQSLVQAGRLLEGAFRPGGTEREFCDPEVLRTIRRRSLTKLRRAIEPVPPAVFGRFLMRWHGLVRPRAGLDGLLDAIEKLQGVPIPASVLEREVLSARVIAYSPGDLDALAAAGELMWCGVESLGERDGRVALFLSDHIARLWQPQAGKLDPREQEIVRYLEGRGASFFSAIARELGGYPGDATGALWRLVWKGLVTNDTFGPLRARITGHDKQSRHRAQRAFRSRRQAPIAAEGRWSLVAARLGETPSGTVRVAAFGEQLLQRHGIVTRETALAEGISGGFAGVYAVFKALEESGRIRRGHFISGISAIQFALPGVIEQLRELRQNDGPVEIFHLAASDPANPYGAALKWPESERMLARSAAGMVIIADGSLLAYMTRGGRRLQVFLPAHEPDKSRLSSALALRLRLLASAPKRNGLVIAEISGVRTEEHPLAPALREAGFLPSPHGYYLPTRAREPLPPVLSEDDA